MNRLVEHLTEDKIYFDGAFGTYIDKIYGYKNAELANLTHPNYVENIHNEYAAAGAQFLRSNTFYANKFALNMDESISRDVIIKGYEIAEKVADEHSIFAGASIGPIANCDSFGEEISIAGIKQEYKRIADVLLDCGAKNFVFETLHGVEEISEVVQYIKQTENDSFVLCQFAIRPDGHTKNSISLEDIVKQAKKLPCDGIGLNCATGPMHILSNIKKVIDKADRPMSALPNAGFPGLVEGRQVYSAGTSYFAEMMSSIEQLGVKILGGCCGTTPEHIKAMVEYQVLEHKNKAYIVKKRKIKKPAVSQKLELFVELTPPDSGTIDDMIEKVERLVDLGATKITLPDCPMAKPRMNPTLAAAAIKNQLSVDTIVHMSCRDKNITALHSELIGSYAIGNRDVLCVTGDPVPAGDRDEIKSVFNISSIGLIQRITNMNKDYFSKDPVNIYGAVNLSAKNKKAFLTRVANKAAAGANGFLTQPIYSEKHIEGIQAIKRETGKKVFAGIMPPVSYRNAMFIKNEVPGVDMPDKIAEAFFGIEDKDRAENMSVEIFAQIAGKALEYADGLYLILPFGRTSLAEKLLDLLEK